MQRRIIPRPLLIVSLILLIVPGGGTLSSRLHGAPWSVGCSTAYLLLAQVDGGAAKRRAPSSGGKDSPKNAPSPAPVRGPDSKNARPGDSSVSRNPAPGKPSDNEAEKDSGSMVDRMVSFIRNYATWILVVLGGALLGVLAWAWLGSRGKRAAESPFAELGLAEETRGRPATGLSSGRYSSTKIQAADVSNRIAGSVKTTEVETDREYALVVDEEALKMPPLPEGAEDSGHHRTGSSAGGRGGDPSAIQRLIDAGDYHGAYEEYVRHIDAHAAASLKVDVERALSDHFLRARDLEKAARVLEHHVATHAKTEVHPEAYFNLGYIHFMNRTFAKSRRFLKLFVEAERNPMYRNRAIKILEKMKGSASQN
ncbi:MAG TPA: hypothetical protein VMT52_07195 [Planctomycetota bacterium]|nr:hypothetical protein [Planctomycetota bacterium]